MARKKKGKKKRVLKGILGKMGAIIMGTAPIVSVIEGGAFAAAPERENLPIGDKLLLFATRTLNNLSAGLMGKDIFPSVHLSGQLAGTGTVVGNAWKVGTEQHMPWLISTLTGAGFMLADRVSGYLTKSATRIAGVNITGKY